MKNLILFVLLLNTTIGIAANTNALQSLLISSDLDCLINFEHKPSKKEQKNIRATLIDIALKVETDAAI